MKDELIALAKEAGIMQRIFGFLMSNQDIERFAALVAAKEREAADKRIAELERNYLDSVEVNTALQHGLNEAEHKLTVAREALRMIAGERLCPDLLMGNVDIAREALAQIGEI